MLAIQPFFSATSSTCFYRFQINYSPRFQPSVFLTPVSLASRSSRSSTWSVRLGPLRYEVLSFLMWFILKTEDLFVLQPQLQLCLWFAEVVLSKTVSVYTQRWSQTNRQQLRRQVMYSEPRREAQILSLHTCVSIRFTKPNYMRYIWEGMGK